jgi:hypothetical protein
MATNTTTPAAVASSKSSSKTPTDKNGDPWKSTHNEQLIQLATHISIDAIQATYFPSFTSTQLRQILAHAQAGLATSHQSTCVNAKEAIKDADDPNSDSDEVIDAGFAKRRRKQPVWQGTTTAWASKGKPGIGWLLVDERPDMETFLCNLVPPQDGERE